MLEPKHANAWFQWCNIPLFVFVVLFYDGIICLAFLILSDSIIFWWANTCPLNGWCTSPDPAPFDDSQPGSRYPWCFADVSIDGWKPFRGLLATTRKWLWTSGFDVSVCRQRDHMLPPPEHGSGRQQNLLSHLVSLLYRLEIETDCTSMC